MRAIGVTDKHGPLTVMNRQPDQDSKPINALTGDIHAMRRLHHGFVLAVNEFQIKPRHRLTS
jgi:hypothetical protein